MAKRNKNDGLDDLFADLANDRPERVARGALVHALRKSRTIRERLHGRKIEDEAELQPPRIEVETEGGWRADIVVDGAKVELKIWALPTPRQREAICRGAMDVLVVPSSEVSHFDGPKPPRVVSWNQLAEALGEEASADPPMEVVAGLLRAADSFRNPKVDPLRPDSIRKAWDCYVGRSDSCDGGETALLGAFLSALSIRLGEAIPDYAESDGRSHAHGKDYDYYGYHFKVGKGRQPPAWWVGFETDEEDPAQPRLSLYRSDKIVLPQPLGEPLPLDDFVGRIRGEITKSVGVRKPASPRK